MYMALTNWQLYAHLHQESTIEQGWVLTKSVWDYKFTGMWREGCDAFVTPQELTETTFHYVQKQTFPGVMEGTCY